MDSPFVLAFPFGTPCPSLTDHESFSTESMGSRVSVAAQRPALSGSHDPQGTGTRVGWQSWLRDKLRGGQVGRQIGLQRWQRGRGHVREARASGTCERHVRAARASCTCKWHVRAARASGTCELHVQAARASCACEVSSMRDAGVQQTHPPLSTGRIWSRGRQRLQV
eukprot:1885303-Rhodomonas_salina.1